MVGEGGGEGRPCSSEEPSVESESSESDEGGRFKSTPSKETTNCPSRVLASEESESERCLGDGEEGEEADELEVSSARPSVIANASSSSHSSQMQS